MQPSKDDWVPSSNPLNIYCMRNVPNGTESVTDDDSMHHRVEFSQSHDDNSDSKYESEFKGYITVILI